MMTIVIVDSTPEARALLCKRMQGVLQLAQRAVVRFPACSLLPCSREEISFRDQPALILIGAEYARQPGVMKAIRESAQQCLVVAVVPLASRALDIHDELERLGVSMTPW
jgi:hypothetical protein